MYSFTSTPVRPVTYILVPSLLKAKPHGLSSCPDIEKASVNTEVETSKPVDSAYSFTSSPVAPRTNILVPSVLNAKPLGLISWPETLKLSTNDAEDKSPTQSNVVA